MHPRNIYNQKPDFGELAKVRPSLKPFLIAKSKSPAKQGTDQQQQQQDEATSSDIHRPDDFSTAHTATISLSDEEDSQTDQPCSVDIDTHSPPPHPKKKKKKSDVMEHQSTERFPYTLDFSNPSALRELTCAVLERDFGLRVEIPVDKLIPAVPQRLNYIHWIEDLLMCGCCHSDDKGGISSDDDDNITVPKGESIIGIDIGTGASCIYPLLATKMNSWKFLATEIDEEALRYAQENVSRNELDDKIEVKLVSPTTILLGAVNEAVQYSFCMCNPPFFRDRDDRYGVGGATRLELRPPPSTFSSGTLGETVTEGGEVEFVKRIIRDSLTLRSKIRWYSSMLGKKTSVKQVLSELKQCKVPVTATTEFVQGKTWRWAVAWSFDESLIGKVGKLSKPLSKRTLKRHRPLFLQLASDTSFDLAESIVRAKHWLLEQLEHLKIKYTMTADEEDIATGKSDEDRGEGVDQQLIVQLHCVAKRNTWSHQRRKRRLMEKLQVQQSATSQDSAKQHIPSDYPAPSFPPTLISVPTTTTKTKMSAKMSSETDHLSGLGSSVPTGTDTVVSGNSEGGKESAPSQESRQVHISPHRPSSLTSPESGSALPPSLVAIECPEAERRKAINKEIESLCPPCELEFNCLLLTGYPVHMLADVDSNCNVQKTIRLEKDGRGKKARMDDSKSTSASKKKKKMKKSAAVKDATKFSHTSNSNQVMVARAEDQGEFAESAVGGKSGPQLFLEFNWLSGEDKDLLHQIVQFLKNKSQGLML